MPDGGHADDPQPGLQGPESGAQHRGHKCGVTPWVLPDSISDADIFVGLSYTRSARGEHVVRLRAVAERVLEEDAHRVRVESSAHHPRVVNGEGARASGRAA